MRGARQGLGQCLSELPVDDPPADMSSSRQPEWDEARAGPPVSLAIPETGDCGNSLHRHLSRRTLALIRADWSVFVDWSLMQAQDASPEDLIVGFVRAERDRGVSLTLARRRVYSVSVVYEFNQHDGVFSWRGTLRGVYREAPWQPETSRALVAASADEFATLLRSQSGSLIDTRNDAILWSLYDGLLLSEEVVRLDYDDIEVEGGIVKMAIAPLRSNREWRGFTLCEKASQAISRWIAHTQPGPLFVTLSRRSSMRRMRATDIHAVLVQRCQESGVRRLRPTELLMGGVAARRKRRGSYWTVQDRLGRKLSKFSLNAGGRDFTDREKQFREYLAAMDRLAQRRRRPERPSDPGRRP